MIRVKQVKVLVELDSKDEKLSKIAHKLNISKSDIISFDIKKQSIDARKKESIFYVYEFDVNVKKEGQILKYNKSNDISLSPIEEYKVPKKGTKQMQNKPVIVGMGPAGLFAAYILSENGYDPIIIDRGEKMEDRKTSVSNFWETGILNPNSNVQFGEGGAGTFSDGKLNTLVKDKEFRGKKVFETFIKHGAPKEILYLQKPHIGTDLLSEVISNMRDYIISKGGTFLYNTKLTDLNFKKNELVSIEVNNKEEIECNDLILAIGHSARDTFELLLEKGFDMKAKPFAIGVRIQHPQKMIDESQYGKKYSKILNKASYKLTYTTSKKRGVYSFCMCPGGFVVNASSEEGRLCVNGMSNHDRNEENANSAIVVTITPDDFGLLPLDGINFQRKLEEIAYKKGNAKIPVQLWKDFKDNKISSNFEEVKPCIKGEYTFSNLKEILPNYITESIEEAIPNFGKKIKGFDREDSILAGIESRTSSPVRIERDENFESNLKGVYPCGEGAGYAGGITTAAMDGIRVAETIIKKYNNI